MIITNGLLGPLLVTNGLGGVAVAGAPIVPSVGSTMAAATGRPNGGHLRWAPNFGKWWLTYLQGTQGLAALYSDDFLSWTAPTGSPYALLFPHASNALGMGTSLSNIASKDILHVNAAETNGYYNHYRFTVGSTWANTNANAQMTGDGGGPIVQAISLAMDSSNKPWYAASAAGSSHACGGASATNADSGTSWTSGWNAPTQIVGSGGYCCSTAIFSLGGGSMIGIAGQPITNSTINNVAAQRSATWGGAATLIFSNFTTCDGGAWGAIDRTISDIHVVTLSNNSNAYLHARFNGTSWSAGSAIPSSSYGPLSGIYVETDGTRVWAFKFDTSKQLAYTTWTSGSGWSAWIAISTPRTNQPQYLTGAYGNGKIGLIWTEVNGANYDIVGTMFSPPVAGTLAAAGGNDTFAGAGVQASSAVLAATGRPDTFAGSGVQAVPAVLAATGRPDTFTGDATFTIPVALAALAATGRPDTFAGVGIHVSLAALAVTTLGDTFVGLASSSMPVPVELGRFRLGDVVEVVMTPAVLPDKAPLFTVSAEGGEVVETVDGWTWDGVTFRADLLLGAQYPVGTFLVSSSIAGEIFVKQFSVVPGGDPGSDVVAIYEHDGASSRTVLAQLQSGKIVCGVGPYLE